MVWNKPICQTCNKEIKHPQEAVVTYTSSKFFVAPFHHVKCFLNQSQEYASDVSPEASTALGVAATATGGITSGIGAIRGINSIENLKSINPKDAEARKNFQSHLNKGFLTVLAGTLFFDFIIVVGLLSFSKLNFDWIGWIAAALFFGVGAILTYSSLSFVYYSLYLWSEIKRSSKRK